MLKKYPRKLQINGQRYTANDYLHEREIFQNALDRAEYQDATSTAPTPLARIRNRAKKAADEHEQHLAHLRKQDEELLFLL